MKTPKTLYKYYSLANPKRIAAAEALITRNEIFRANPATHFNDPFDCKPFFRAVDVHSKDYEQAFYAKLAHLPKWQVAKMLSLKRADPNEQIVINLGLFKMQNAFSETSSVFCMTEKPDNLLMWSHYADSHKGICIGFNIADETDFLSHAHPVSYSSKYPFFDPVAEKDGQIVMEKCFLTKAKDWEYEAEWRVVFYKMPSGTSPIKPSNLISVILGARASIDSKQLVRRWLSTRNDKLKISEASFVSGEFALRMKPILDE